MYKKPFSLTHVALEQLCRMMSWHYQIKFGNKKRIDICWTKFTVTIIFHYGITDQSSPSVEYQRKVL